MSKKVTITAFIVIDHNDVGNVDMIAKILSKNFGKKEITNIHPLEEFVCFNVNNAICVPFLLTLFTNVQLYVNGGNVNMAMLK